jgi:uncharacterized protein Veg
MAFQSIISNFGKKVKMVKMTELLEAWSNARFLVETKRVEGQYEVKNFDLSFLESVEDLNL